MRNRVVGAVLSIGAALGCTSEVVVPGAALESITMQDLRPRIAMLASDSFAGRGPSSVGEDRTVEYLRREFRALGLEPGNDTSYYQEVPLVRITAESTMVLTLRKDARTTRLRFGTDFVGGTRRVVDSSAVRNAELVFVGYGIVAPEYDWNDYAGLDVRGKTVVILVNDPGFATQDTALFRGNSMTYYGRWTYKYEEAARQGAEGAIIVHETEPAAYGWTVVKNGWSGPQFHLETPDRNMSRTAFEGWMSLEAAQELFRMAGLSYVEQRDRASTREFTPVPLGVSASVTVRNRIERSRSKNVLAVLPGTGHADEYVLYVAHWDHFGTDAVLQGDQIFNGARDNATGTAALLEIAEAFQAAGTRPARSILFVAVTAEEQGLLGSQYFALNPTVPLSKMVAVLNMDAMNIFGPTRDITIVGYGNSELDDLAAAAAAAQGRTVRPDPEPEKGYFYRSDHFSFSKRGVPALYVDQGVDHVEHGEAWMMERKNDYTANRYHTPADEMTADWDLRGLVDDLRLLFRVGYGLANSRQFPNWRPGTEFRAARDAMMGTP